MYRLFAWDGTIFSWVFSEIDIALYLLVSQSYLGIDLGKIKVDYVYYSRPGVCVCFMNSTKKRNLIVRVKMQQNDAVLKINLHQGLFFDIILANQLQAFI